MSGGHDAGYYCGGGFGAILYGCGCHVEVRHHTTGAVDNEHHAANIRIQFRRLYLLYYPFRFPRIEGTGQRYHCDRINGEGDVVEFVPFSHIRRGGSLDGAFRF